MIQVNPTLATLRRARLALFFGVPVFVVIIIDLLYTTIIPYINTIFFSPTSALSELTFPILMLVAFVVMLVTNTLQARYWQRIEQHRFATTQRDQTLPASEQPLPNESSLPLPITLQLRYRKESLPLSQVGPMMTAVLLSVLVSGTGSLVTSIFTFHHLTTAGWALIFFLVALVIVFIVIALFLSKQLSQQVSVTEDGLTSCSMGQVNSIRWNEACLFARYETFGAQKSGAALTYELSGARDTVRWTWIRHKTYLVGLEPILPPDEYNRQMEAILSLVAAKTGLTLHDLSERRS